MLFVLYLMVCVTGLGLAYLGPLFSVSSPWGDFTAADIMLIALLVLTLPGYFRQRQKIGGPWFRVVETAWIVLILLITVQSFRSPAASLTNQLRNVRFVQSYLLFFPSIAVLTTRSRLRTVAIVGGLFAVIGVALTVLQSRHGLTNLTSSPFYDTGPWPGQHGMVGGITRVNLAITDWIAFCLLFVLALSLVRFRLWHVLLAGVFTVAILITFTRLLWLGLAVGFVVEVILLLFTGGARLRDLLKLSLAPLGLILVLVGVAQFASLGGLGGAVLDRVQNGLFHLATGSGTWAVRLADQNLAMTIWSSSPLFGVGTVYYPAVGRWLDLGLPVTLVSIGVVGLAIEFLMLVACLLAGIATLKEGVKMQSPHLKVIGASIPALVVLILVYQQWMNIREFAILALMTAVALNAPSILQAVTESGPRRRYGFVFQVPPASTAQKSSGRGA